MAFYPILVKVDFGTENSFSSSSLYFVEMFSINLHEKKEEGVPQKETQAMHVHVHVLSWDISIYIYYKDDRFSDVCWK